MTSSVESGQVLIRWSSGVNKRRRVPEQYAF